MHRYFSSAVLYSAFPASDPCLVFIWNPKSYSRNYISQKPSESDLDINNQMFVLDKVSDGNTPAQPGDAKQSGQIWRPLKVLPTG